MQRNTLCYYFETRIDCLALHRHNPNLGTHNLLLPPNYNRNDCFDSLTHPSLYLYTALPVPYREIVELDIYYYLVDSYKK